MNIPWGQGIPKLPNYDSHTENREFWFFRRCRINSSTDQYWEEGVGVIPGRPDQLGVGGHSQGDSSDHSTKGLGKCDEEDPLHIGNDQVPGGGNSGGGLIHCLKPDSGRSQQAAQEPRPNTTVLLLWLRMAPETASKA
jgi:hypothetical protein